MRVSIVLALLGKENNKKMKLIIFLILFNLGRLWHKHVLCYKTCVN